MSQPLDSTSAAPAFPLSRSLTGLLTADPAPVLRTGPRWWWGGPLDVEGLALGSAEAFVTALSSLAPSSARRFSLDSAVVAASFGSFGRLTVDGSTRAGFAPLSGFHRSADGWVRLHANYPHHEMALVAALGARDADDVPAKIARRSADDVEAIVTAGGGLAVAVRTPDRWLGSASAASLAARPWLQWATEEVGSAPIGSSLGTGPQPLHGMRVLDLTRVIAGPSASRLLGALGADVLRIDPPAIPELWDQYVDTGFDKRSAVVDLGDRASRTELHELLAHTDAALLGYSLVGLGRFGFDPVSLREKHPHLAVVSLDAWDPIGPDTDRPGFDSIVQAATGIADVYGEGEENEWRPGALPVQALDHATGLGMGAAALALLANRREGRSGRAHLSLARTALELLRAGPPAGSPAPLAPVELREAPSAFGRLGFVPPPLNVDDTQLEYTAVPEPYGSSSLAWR